MAWRGMVGAVLVVAAVASCSGSGPPGPAAPTGTGAGETARPDGSAATRTRFGAAHQGALALVALGALGEQRGAAADVRALGADVLAAGQRLGEQVRAAATDDEVVLGDNVAAGTQDVIGDLGDRSGRSFDEAWLPAVLEATEQARDAAAALPADPDAGLDALAARVRAVAAS